MQPVLKKSSLYKKTIFKLSLFTTVFVFGCILFGYFFLPMASAFYAALLVYENNSKRVMSYALPVVMFLINLVLRDFSFYSLEAIAYVAVGLIIYLTCNRDISKGESAFWTTFAITVMLVISAIFLAFETLGSFGMTPLQQFFSNLFLSYKSFFVDLLTSITVLDKEGVSFFAYNPGEAELFFHEIVILLIPIIILFAFLLSGIAFKIFRSIIVMMRNNAGNPYLVALLNYLAYYNVGLAMYNCLPVAPMDCVKVLAVVLPANQYFKLMQNEKMIQMIFLFMLFFGLITGWMDTLIYGVLNLFGNILGMA